MLCDKEEHEEICSRDDALHEECGVFGVHKVANAAQLTYYGLHALQHRGQEACGIAASDGNSFLSRKGMGLVTENFNMRKIADLKGDHALGHVRYSTAGANIIENVQPIMVRSHQGYFAVAHNGQLVNAEHLRIGLEMDGSIFQGTADTEIIAHLIQRGEGSLLEKIKYTANLLDGAFSFVVMTKNTMYAVRDRYGIRPLSIGTLEGGYVVSSETCAFDTVGATFLRDVEPGEIVKFGKTKVESVHFAPTHSHNLCAMEYIYFARPDSDLEGINVHAARKQTGRVMAMKDDVEADIVVGVPDSSLSAAMGYAEVRKIPYEMGLLKNKYTGRTFIQPRQEDRERGVKMKLSAIKSIVKGKRIIILDDSIVRGTTSLRIVKLLREAGAKEIHLRIVAPPLISPCFYGVDLKTKQELISARMHPDELCRWLKADSLKFLDIEDMRQCFTPGICTACFDGKYVTPLYTYQKELEKEFGK